MKKTTDKEAIGSHKTGPKPETFKIEGSWEDSIEKALKKKRPKDGWPKPEKKGKK